MIKLRIAALQGPCQKYRGEPTKAKNVEWTVDQIRSLSRYGLDIICLPEVFSLVGLEHPTAEQVEPVPGPTTETMMKLAKEFGAAIVCPVIENRRGEYYNTAVVIDEKGTIVGQYDKIHPTEPEMEKGVVPGKVQPTVIDLCGVKTAYQICFDANWTQDWLNLKSAGAQLVFFCSWFSAGTILNGLAIVLRLPIVAATVAPHCRILDRVGQLLAHQGPDFDFARADVLINQPVFHLDFFGDTVDAIRRDERNVGVFNFNGNGIWSLVGTGDPQVLQSIIDKYDLIDVDDYLLRAERKQDEGRR